MHFYLNRLYFDFPYFYEFSGEDCRDLSIVAVLYYNTFSLCNGSNQCTRYVIVMHTYSAKFLHVSLWTMIIIISVTRRGIQPFELARLFHLNENGFILDGLKGERLTNCHTFYIYS